MDISSSWFFFVFVLYFSHSFVSLSVLFFRYIDPKFNGNIDTNEKQPSTNDQEKNYLYNISTEKYIKKKRKYTKTLPSSTHYISYALFGCHFNLNVIFIAHIN